MILRICLLVIRLLTSDFSPPRFVFRFPVGVPLSTGLGSPSTGRENVDPFLALEGGELATCRASLALSFAFAFTLADIGGKRAVGCCLVMDCLRGT